MPSQATPLIFLAIAVLIFFRLRRRLRPTPVRPDRAFIYVGVIFLAAVLGLVGSLNLLETPLGAGLIPVMIAVGAALGLLLTNTMTFYRGPDGNLWMKGGALFIGIFLGIIALRLGVRYVATGGSFAQTGQESPTILNIVSADLLFLSVGLWSARAVALWRRHRAHLTSDASQPA